MQSITFYPTKKSALAVVASLSDTSKMPGKSWGISAALCQTGQKLAKLPGSVCSDCYACKGSYRMYPAVATAHAARIEAFNTDPLSWGHAMVKLIEGESFFRWFDSGDIQSADMLRAIIAVAARTPNTMHWIATREVNYVRQAIAGKEIPPNVVIRVSDTMPNADANPDRVAITGNIAQVYTGSPQKGAHVCPAPSQGGSCGQCRACWNPDVESVTYRAH